MKNALVSSLVLVASVCGAQTTYENSPYNYQNSEFNYANSPYNYANSPYNYENSQYNVNSKNAIIDNQGRNVGYTTQSASGVQNFYDNSGNRIGYNVK